MDADEIQPLTAEAAARLAGMNESTEGGSDEPGKRARQRWPFPGAVELWIPGEDETELHQLAVCHNLSDHGIGVRCDEPLDVGMTLPLAIHLPEASFHGKGQVRHCSPRTNGFLVGIEFVF